MALFTHTLRGLRAQILAYGLGLALWAAIEVLLFPSVRDTIGAVEYPEGLLEAFGAAGTDLSNPRTFFDLEFFSLGPLITATFALFASTAALAGEESGGTMEFLASLPLSRRSMFGAKVLADVVGLIGVIGVTILGWMVATPFVDLGSDLSLLRLAAATLLQVSFVGFIIALGLMFGAVAPSRSAAAGCTAGVLIISYLFVFIAGFADRVENLKYLSPYYYADLSGVLSGGASLGHQGLLWLMTGVTGWLALRGFEGRELGSERWQFHTLLPQHLLSPLATVPVPARWRVFRGRSRMWWTVFSAAVLLASAGAGWGIGLVASREGRSANILSVKGRIDSLSAVAVAPTSGEIRLLTVVEGDHVTRGETIGWLVGAMDGSAQPVSAPMSGTITGLPGRPGQVVSLGSPIAVVHQLDTLRVVLEIDEAHIDRVAVGQDVDVTLRTLGIEARTAIDKVLPVPISSDTAKARDNPQYRVECPLPNLDPRVTVGMLVDARIHLGSGR